MAGGTSWHAYRHAQHAIQLKGWPVMIRRRLVSAGVLAAICLATIAVAVSAQTEQRSATLDDVVAEMRALRADLQQTAGASMRMQLLTARLALQEQRIAVLSNQRAAILAQLAAAVEERRQVETRVASLQLAVQSSADLRLRSEIAQMLEAETTRISQHRQVEQGLRAQEADASAQIALEQGRWQEFNTRLDELERSLALPTQP